MVKLIKRNKRVHHINLEYTGLTKIMMEEIIRRCERLKVFKAFISRIIRFWLKPNNNWWTRYHDESTQRLFQSRLLKEEVTRSKTNLKILENWYSWKRSRPKGDLWLPSLCWRRLLEQQTDFSEKDGPQERYQGFRSMRSLHWFVEACPNRFSRPGISSNFM